MYYGEIKNCDIANGEGVRVTLFVSGCTNHCKNCFQPQTWDFCYGQPFTTETEDYLLSLLSPVYINGLTLLGGEPFEPENQRALVPFLRRVRQMYPDKTIWGFSGFTYEELTSDGTHPRCEVTDEMLSGGRPLRRGAEGPDPPVPGQLQPAAHRPERQPSGRLPLFPAGPPPGRPLNSSLQPVFSEAPRPSVWGASFSFGACRILKEDP